MGLLIVKMMVVTSSIANRLKRAQKNTNSVLMTLRAKISPAPIGEENKIEICEEDGNVTVEECPGACECFYEDPFDINALTCACGCEEGAQKCSTLCNGQAGEQCVLTCDGENYVETEDCGSQGLVCVASGSQAVCQ